MKPTRRDILKGAAAASLAPLPALARGEGDLVRRENEREGTTDWQLTYTRADRGGIRCPWIEGYVSRASVRAGETLEFKVSTEPPNPFVVDVYRMGYPGPKGNFVFNASTIFWAQGLASPPGHTLPYTHNGRPHGPDPRVERITRNLFNRLRG